MDEKSRRLFNHGRGGFSVEDLFNFLSPDGLPGSGERESPFEIKPKSLNHILADAKFKGAKAEIEYLVGAVSAFLKENDELTEKFKVVEKTRDSHAEKNRELLEKHQAVEKSRDKFEGMVGKMREQLISQGIKLRNNAEMDKRSQAVINQVLGVVNNLEGKMTKSDYRNLFDEIKKIITESLDPRTKTQ